MKPKHFLVTVFALLFSCILLVSCGDDCQEICEEEQQECLDQLSPEQLNDMDACLSDYESCIWNCLPSMPQGSYDDVCGTMVSGSSGSGLLGILIFGLPAIATALIKDRLARKTH